MGLQVPLAVLDTLVDQRCGETIATELRAQEKLIHTAYEAPHRTHRGTAA